MKNFFSMVVLMWFCFWIQAPIIAGAIDSYRYNHIYPQGYVASISVTEYQSKDIKRILEEFNEMGDGKAVRFKKDKRDRPIDIIEVDDPNPLPKSISNTGTVLGLASVGDLDCRITLRKSMPYDMLRRVLIHEYLHCMGYRHTDESKKDDLMNPYDSDVTESNIKGYAQDLKKRM